MICHRTRRRRIAGAVTLGFVLAALGCGEDDSNSTAGRDGVVQSNCAVGDERKARNAPHGRRAIVLGCAGSQEGRQIEIYSFRDAAGPCLNVAGMRGGPRACGRPPSERRPASRAPLSGPAIAQPSDQAPIEIYGETAARVTRVMIRYRRSGTRRATRATLVRVQDRNALDAAGIERPFGYFVGSVPSSATGIVAEARAADGHTLGRLDFDPVVESMPPTAFIATEQ